MKIGSIALPSPFVVSPMAGMTDTAFRRLVKRQGGCGLVVSEMVSAEGLVRGIDRTLEYAEYTEEERPVSIQIFGGDPERMAEAVGKPDLAPEITGKYRIGDIRHCIADVSLARRVLGYEPKVTLERGIAELARWLDGQVAIDRIAEASEELSARGLTL